MPSQICCAALNVVTEALILRVEITCNDVLSLSGFVTFVLKICSGHQ